MSEFGPILIVDDDEEAVTAFMLALRLEGYAVEAATTEAEAIARVQANPPAAILMDLHLGDGIDGVTLLERLRALTGWRTIPAAIVTGDYQIPGTTLVQIARLGGIVRYKPLWIEDLVKLVNAMIGGDLR